jgi:NTP pyrophosphatase (non-canonical NTP hydrolase)
MERGFTDDLIENVIGWAAERGIFDNPNPQAQLLKTVEELGEVAHSLARNNLDGQIDGVGDVIVTLILFAHIQGFDIPTALNAAWNEIKDRKGRMQNGFFVKSEDDTQGSLSLA